MEPSPASKYTAEFVGTFMLVFTVGCNVLSGNAVWGGVSIASVLMVSIYSLAGISGANFNPAVSFALGLAKSMGNPHGLDWKEVGIYSTVQLLAGLVGAFCYAALFFDTFNLEPAQPFGLLEAGLCEVFYTFMLCFVVLNCAIAKNTNGDNEFFGLAIGFVIVAGAYGAGAVSGGCFNPAVAMGLDSVSVYKGFGWCIVYIACELVGAALAAAAFRFCRPEEFGGEKTIASDAVSELLGTFMLVLTVGLNVLGKSPAGAFSIAASLMCMIYALGTASGAHFNPAVTVALLAAGEEKDAKKAGVYMASQLAGGIAAAFTYSLIRHESFPLGPGANFGWVEVGVAELMFTFFLCYTVLCVAASTQTKSKTMFGLAIGACVTVGGNAIGAISGGSLNPAVSFGISTSHLMHGGSLTAALAYTVFELTGAGLAAGVYKATHPSDASSELKEKQTV